MLRAERRAAWKRKRAAAFVSVLIALEPEMRMNPNEELVGQSSDDFILGPTVADKSSDATSHI